MRILNQEALMNMEKGGVFTVDNNFNLNKEKLMIPQGIRPYEI